MRQISACEHMFVGQCYAFVTDANALASRDTLHLHMLFVAKNILCYLVRSCTYRAVGGAQILPLCQVLNGRLCPALR